LSQISWRETKEGNTHFLFDNINKKYNDVNEIIINLTNSYGIKAMQIIVYGFYSDKL